MARALFDQLVLPSGCHMVMLEIWTDIGGIPPTAPERMPAVRSSTGGVAVLTRCEDFGKVALAVWAGDPGPPPAGWRVVFDGDLETHPRGFDAGTATASLSMSRRLRAHTESGLRPGKMPPARSMESDSSGFP
jgi:hypothetical protein